MKVNYENFTTAGKEFKFVKSDSRMQHLEVSAIAVCTTLRRCRILSMLTYTVFVKPPIIS
jgi:hypothetical protein